MSVLILSTNIDFLETIAKSLNDAHFEQGHSWRLLIHKSISMNDVIFHSSRTGTVSIDFVVIAFDSSKTICLDWTKKAIRQCHPDLRLGRILLVNATGAPGCMMNVNADEFLELKKHYGLKLLNANVKNLRESVHLGSRIMVVLETVIGFGTGIPNLIT